MALFQQYALPQQCDSVNLALLPYASYFRYSDKMTKTHRGRRQKGSSRQKLVFYIHNASYKCLNISTLSLFLPFFKICQFPSASGGYE